MNRGAGAEVRQHLFHEGGTLYPHSRSLENEGALRSYSQETEAGPGAEILQPHKKGAALLTEERAAGGAMSRPINSVVGLA
jgi:DNA-binding PadR family transcriptional regulator